jgi:hypothetical protein
MTSGPPAAGSIVVTRALPIDAVLLAEVLLGLRRDAADTALRWSLGDRGIAEVDSQFAPVEPSRGRDAAAWSTSARLWDGRGLVVAGASVVIVASTPDTATLTVQPSRTLPAWWEARLAAFLDLVHAFVDELAEELLWHATRDRIATQ